MSGARDRRFAVLIVILSAVLAVMPVSAGSRPEYQIEIRNHLFLPSELVIPAHTRVKLLVTNSDPTPEEFESYELNREKVIMGQRTAVIFIGPLRPGKYPFFGEFHPKTAQGLIVAE